MNEILTPAHDDLLSVTGLNVHYGDEHVVKDVSFTLQRGKTVSLIGQSGSGKSTIANSILRLLSSNVARVSGQILFEGNDIATISNADFRSYRQDSISYVPQDPTNSLNPVRKIGPQLVEVLNSEEHLTAKEKEDLAKETLAKVGLPDVTRILGRYPHQLSGGQQQRVLIATAIIRRPKLIVADEPTSALDVTVQRTILDLLDTLQSELDLGILLITHDLSLAVQRSNSVIVLNHGEIQEHGEASQVLYNPTSEYAQKLYSDIPSLDIDRFRRVKQQRDRPSEPDVALEINNLHKTFGKRNEFVALSGLSLQVPRGTTHALVGESGSGKTTAIRTVLRLEEQDEGQISIDGEPVTSVSHRALYRLRRNLQLVYQNPFTSLDPLLSVGNLIEQPLKLYRIGNKQERRERALSLLESVGLADKFYGVKPTALSGGQRQRVAIARSLALNPEILVLDEPTSALDVSVQAQILKILVDLQSELNLTYLFVSHDLSVVRQFADTVTVLRKGEVVEQGDVVEVFDNPQADYTKELIRSIPGFGESVHA